VPEADRLNWIRRAPNIQVSGSPRQTGADRLSSRSLLDAVQQLVQQRHRPGLARSDGRRTATYLDDPTSAGLALVRIERFTSHLPKFSILCLNIPMVQERQAAWPGFPEQCRSRHPWRPGTVTVSWEPCDCPAAQAARGGHIEVACDAPGCQELWQKPRHEPFRLPRILGHHRPGR
jgi:hypothetical protein